MSVSICALSRLILCIHQQDVHLLASVFALHNFVLQKTTQECSTFGEREKPIFLNFIYCICPYVTELEISLLLHILVSSHTILNIFSIVTVFYLFHGVCVWGGVNFICKGPDSKYLGYVDYMVFVTIQLCPCGLNTDVERRKNHKLGCVPTHFFSQNKERVGIGMCISFPILDLSCYRTLESVYILCYLLGGKYNLEMLSHLEKLLNSTAFSVCLYQT